MGLFLAAAAGGLLMLPLLPVLPPLWLLWGTAIVALAGWLGWRRPWLLALALGTASLAWSVAAAWQGLEQRIPAAWEGELLTVTGEVQGLPEPLAPQGQRFRFRPGEVMPATGAAVAGQGRWLLFSALPEAPVPGASCRLNVRLKRPHGAANPGGFDYEAWLLSEGIAATGSVKAMHCEPPRGPALDRLRLALRDALARNFPDRPAAGVLLALVSGDRALVDDAAWERYAATGIVHLMAISGLHLSMLAAAVFWLVLRLLRRFPRLGLHWPLHQPALLAGLAVTVGYGAIAGLSIPTQRTLIMLAVVVAATCGRRHVPGFQVLLLALIAVLLWSPLAVHAAGFWLSFGAVAVLLVLGRAWRELPTWRHALQLQFALSLLLLPLTLWFFDRASWVSPFANLLAVPLVTLLVVPLGLLGLLAWLAGWATGAGWLWTPAVILIEVLDALMEQFAAWPAASLAFSLPGTTGLLCLLLALACLLQPLQWRLRLLAPLMLLPILWPAPAVSPGQLRLTVLDVGQGLAILVEAGPRRLLYDTGPTVGPADDAGRRYILPSLHRLGVYSLDRLLLSHADTDHTGGAGFLLAALPIRDGLGARPGAARSLPSWQDCQAGQHWQWEGWDFRILYPDADQRRYARTDNNRSCVLRISRGRASVLLPGDLERLGELSLLDRYPGETLRSQVLVLGHHGSRSSTSPELLDAVRPQLALVSAGYRNTFRHPSRQVVARLEAAGIPWRNTASSGALTLVLQDDGQLQLREFRRDTARYWQRIEAHPFFANGQAAARLALPR